MKEQQFTAQCARDDAGWWVVTVADLPGVVTQARSLTRARDRAREVIGLWLDVATDRVAVEFDVVGAERARSEWIEGREDLQRGTALLQAGSVKTRRAVHDLLAHGLSVRDAAAVLGVSSARVQQLAPSTAAKKAPTKVATQKHTARRRVAANASKKKAAAKSSRRG